MKIYLDTCCYSRVHDEPTLRHLLERVAIASAIETCQLAGYQIVGSMAVKSELGRISSPSKRADIENDYDNAVDFNVTITKKEQARAQVFVAGGLDPEDSAHLAAAEAAGVSILLTVDDDFEKIVTEKKLSTVKVINPLKFLLEVMDGNNG